MKAIRVILVIVAIASLVVVAASLSVSPARAALTGVTYTDDPAAGNTNVVVYGAALGDVIQASSGGTIFGTAATQSASPAMMGGFNGNAAGLGSGATFTATNLTSGGSASCTMVIANTKHYCGIAVPPGPTITPTPTNTFTPTNTPQPTWTFTPSPLPTRQPSPTSLPTLPPTLTFTPSQLPLANWPNESAPCNLVANTNASINVRSQPDAGASIVGQLTNADGSFAISAQSNGWYKISKGWVGGAVVAVGGTGCQNLRGLTVTATLTPTTTQTVTATPTTTQTKVPVTGGGSPTATPTPVNIKAVFNTCPDLWSTLQQFSPQKLNAYAQTSDPCAAAKPPQSNAPQVQARISDHLILLLRTCPAYVPNYLSMIRTLVDAAPSRAMLISTDITAAGRSACVRLKALLTELITQRTPDEASIAACLPRIEPRHVAAVYNVAKLLNLQFVEGMTAEDFCQGIQNLSVLGGVTKAEQGFYTKLVTDCKMAALQAINLLTLAAEFNTDLGAVGQADQTLCADVVSVIMAKAQARAQAPKPIVQCETNLINLFLRWAQLSAVTVAQRPIFASTDPCRTLFDYLLTRQLPAAVLAPVVDDTPTTVQKPIPSKAGLVGNTPLYVYLVNAYKHPLAYFVVKSTDGKSTDIYRIIDHQYEVITQNTNETDKYPVVSPDGWLAYIAVDTTSAKPTTNVKYQSPASAQSAALTIPSGYTVDANSRVAWYPGVGVQRLFVTLLDGAGHPAIFQFNLTAGNPQPPTLVLPDAANPAATYDGDLIYERKSSTTSTIEFQFVDGISAENSNKLSIPTGDANCKAPSPIGEQRRIIFACGTTLYYADLYDKTNTKTVALGRANSETVVVPLIEENYITYADSDYTYYMKIDTREGDTLYFGDFPVISLTWAVQ